MPGVRWNAQFHDEALAALKEGDARKVGRAIEQDIEGTLQELLRNADFGEPEQPGHVAPGSSGRKRLKRR
jgi:DNA-binding GntR family transcriptional regulator